MIENIILVDWFSFTLHELDLQTVIGWLGIDSIDWVDCKGRDGYRSAKFYGGMRINYDGGIVKTDVGLRDMGINVSFSGQGCRQYETSGNRPLHQLVNDVAAIPTANITRLDIAFDDVDHDGNGLLDVQKIERLARRDCYISKFGTRSGEWSGKHSNGSEKNPLAYSVYFGSPRSDLRFRIYDKALERGGLDYHWVRFELQMRDKVALNFIKQDGAIGHKFYGVINNYLRFIVPSKTDTNRRRWASPEWWIKFLAHTEKISVFTRKDVDYNLSRLERYVMEQAGNSIVTYIQCVGWFKFWEMLNARDRELNPNQQKLVDEFDQLMSDKKKELWANSPGSRISLPYDKDEVRKRLVNSNPKYADLFNDKKK